MLQLVNETPFRARVAAMPDRDGIDSLCTVVKATFRLSPDAQPAEEQVPVTLADTYHGKPGASSIRAASDLGPPKPGADVLLFGHARAPQGRATTRVDVTLQVGALRRSVAVFGDRSWDATRISAQMSSPKPFEAMPLVWERAFGGARHPQNPVGTGMDSGAREGARLPNLEDPAELIRSPKDRPAPVAFAPIAPQWEPRRSFAGTYDAAWQRSRAPYLPEDFDPRFLHVAPAWLVSPKALLGGEAIEIRGVHPTEIIRLSLPRMGVETEYLLDDTNTAKPAVLDTLIFEPDESRFMLIWRSQFGCNRRTLRVREIRVRVAAVS